MGFDQGGITRRTLLKTAAACALGFAARGGEDRSMLIIDTHQHLLDQKKYRMRWVTAGSPLARDFGEADYREAVRGLGDVKTVYMEVDVDVAQQWMEADEVATICESQATPMLAAVVSGRPAEAGFAAYVAKLKARPAIKGVRQVLHGQGDPPGFCLGEAFVAGIRRLGESGLSFDLCMRSGELGDAAKLIDLCPDTRFILDHCGNPNVQTPPPAAWKRAIDDLARRDRLVCKVSGLVESARPGAWSAEDLAPYVNHVLDAFGQDRVIFAGNWPVCTLTAPLAEWVKALEAVVRSRPVEQQAKLFHDNAIRIYGLEIKP